jgi:dUTP pyrophosphatase
MIQYATAVDGAKDCAVKMIIKFKKLTQDAKIPSYAHPGDAGLDIYSNEDCVIGPLERKLVSTGIAAEVPQGYAVLIWDKSGVAASGIKTMGGVIDAHYRGEYKIIMFNTGKDPYEIKKGQKIAQALIQPVVSAEVSEAQELNDTTRGEGGFGSTGL